MRWLRILFVLLVGILGLSLANPVEAQSKTLFWDSYDVFLTVRSNGDLHVVERQAITFTEGIFTFGFATIPTDKVESITDVIISEPGGRTYTQRSFTNNAYEYTVNPSNEGVEIRWYFPPASQETRTFDLSYVVQGGVRIYDSGDKLQWIAIDSERDFPIRAASVTVNLPEGAAFEDIDSAGVPAAWSQSEDGRSVTYVAQEQLPAWQTFEIGVEFTHGVVPANPPAWQAAVDRNEDFALNKRPWLNLLIGAFGIVLGVAGLLGVYLLWYSRGRDPKVGPVPEYVTEPPGDVPAGLLGTLIDEQADMPDVVATIVDLARKGYLTIEETESKGFFGLASKDHVFRKVEGMDESELAPYEKRVLRGIFSGSKKERSLTSLRNKFYTKLPGIQEELYKDLVKQGYFRRRPDVVRRNWQIFAILIFGLAFVAFFVVSPLTVYVGALLCVPVALGATGLVLLMTARHMPVKTNVGAEAAERWMAFKRYLIEIEKHMDLKEAGALFEKYLPYAIAFGMNDTWVNKFSKLAETPAPGWYVPYPVGRPLPRTTGGGRLAKPVPEAAGAPAGTGGLQGMSEGLSGGLQSMSDGLTRMLNSTGRVLSSAPSSSGTSGGGGGFGGGGFSVGGGGGGGARGFG